MSSNREIWKSIDGYANYEVSSFGRVRNATTERILKPWTQNTGYLIIRLWRDGNQKQCLVHRLVAQEFVDNPLNKRIVDHIDGVKTNNTFDNLRWASDTENQGNQKNQTNRTSIYKGVSFDRSRNKWMAKIRTTNLGRFESEREAAKAYNEAAKEYFGEFAKLNVVED